MVNPLDPIEFSSFSERLIELPEITNTTVRVPHSYGNLPRNLMEHTIKEDNKFLNKYQHLIEEILHRDKSNLFANSFRQYHQKYFYSNLYHDGFFKAELSELMNIGDTRKSSRITLHRIRSVGTAHVFGTLLTSGDTSSNVAATTGSVYASKVDQAGSIGTYYNLVALDCTLASGNYHIGAYDDIAGNPVNLLADTGSIAITADFSAKPVTEFTLTTSVNWLVYQQDNVIAQFNNKIVSGGSGFAVQVVQVYGSLPNPFGSPTGNTRQYHQSISHS